MKKILTLLIVSIIILTNAAFAESSVQIVGDNNNVIFIDVPREHWAAEEILYFASRDIVSGKGNGDFEPDSMVTREEFTKMLALTYNAPLESPVSSSFEDVDHSRWSYEYVEVCKEFLTGYANPFGGKPTFRPADYATREDIAVAMVRIMGYTDKDAHNAHNANAVFSDAINISPGLVPYISVAYEKGIIGGYPDGTFQPTKGISRAETVVLLNRATKQAFTTMNAELSMNVTTKKNIDDPTDITITIESEEGVDITMDGESVYMYHNGYGHYTGTRKYKFTEEGSKTFEVHGKKGNRTRTINTTVKYEIGAPSLTVNQISERVTTDSIVITGNASDDVDKDVSIFVNGEHIALTTFRVKLSLQPGENKFVFKSVNSSGKESAPVEKIVFFEAPAPVLTIDNVASKVSVKEFLFLGKATDVNDSQVKIYMNGEYLTAARFDKDVILKEGTNTFTFKAVNKYGKESETITKTVVFEVGIPNIAVDYTPDRTDVKVVEISGSAADGSGEKPEIYINNELMGKGNFRKKFTLTEGKNTFVIKSRNSYGKESPEVIREIYFEPSAPTIKVSGMPERSSVATAIAITVTASDVNDSAPKIYMNGELIGEKNADTTLWLKAGVQVYTFKAVNSYGKESEILTKSIEYVSPTPEISLKNSPAVTNEPEMLIEGYVLGSVENLKIFINGSQVLYVTGEGNERHFVKEVTLTEGRNEFTIKAINSDGKSATIVKTVDYSPEID